MPDQDDADYVGLGKLAHKVLHGKNRMKFLELAQEEEPTVPIAEVQSKKMIEDATKPLMTRIDTLEAENSKLKGINDIEGQRRAIKKKLGIDDETLDKVEKIMVEHSIAKHESAFTFMQNAEKVAAPRPNAVQGGRQYEPAKMPTMTEAFIKNPTQGARDLAHSVIEELRGVKRT